MFSTGKKRALITLFAGLNLLVGSALAQPYLTEFAKPNKPSIDYVDYLAQKDKKSIKSRSEVVAEVKRRYRAEVLRVKLNSSKTAYNVRVLLPNGKVRSVTVSATK